MARLQPFALGFAKAVTKHLRSIDARYHALIHKAIEDRLRFTPSIEDTNRKPLRQPALFGATWEIRFGPENRFRVLYDVSREEYMVRILAIGEKRKERLFIGGEEVQL